MTCSSKIPRAAVLSSLTAFCLSLPVLGSAADQSDAAQTKPTKQTKAKTGFATEVVTEVVTDVKERDPSGPDKAAAATVDRPDAQGASQSDDDLTLNRAQPDFTVIGLATTLRLPKFKSVFRLTHRFNQAANQATLGDLFGLDAGAQIGLEYRFGIWSGTQVGIHRTSDRTIEFFAQHDVAQQGHKLPLGVAALASIEGRNNFHQNYSPALGAVVSRTINDYVALYVEPIWINNSNPLPKELVDHNDTFMVGLGARVRIRPTVYVVGEFDPRTAGYRPGVNYRSFGIEKRAGGHMFQLNFSNGFGTTRAQLARGGTAGNNWYIGFNLLRKFY